MVNNKKRKLSVKRKRFLLLNTFLFIFLFFGMGYSVFYANLNIGGELNLKKYTRPTLYNVLKKEYETNGLAGKYTGEHQDSIDVSNSTENIYYYVGNVRNKYNVVFADMCWQMLRTTDTGGVRMIYNGEPTITEVDGVKHYDCGDSRPHHMGNTQKEINLAGTYVYGKGYTATVSEANTTFTLSDTTTIEINVNNATEQIANIKENYPYTCNNNSGVCTNDGLYKINNQSNGTKVMSYKSTYNDSIGLTTFNSSDKSPALAGYMYGDVYNYATFNATPEQKLTVSQNIYSSSITLNTNYYYADSIDWDTTTSNKYTLLSPTKITAETDYDSLVGKYVIENSTNNIEVYYIIGIYETNKAYVKKLSSGNIDISIRFADDLTSTGELDNPTAPVTLKDWYIDYANYVEKYTCGDSSTVCQKPRFITGTTEKSYIYMAGNITISKTRSNLELTDYVTIDYGKWYSGYNTTYKDYVYTCSDTSTTCTEENLRYIVSRTSKSYNYAANHYFGKSVIYEDNKYKLQDTVDLEKTTDTTSLATHHYVCLTPGLKECERVAYVHYYTGSGGMFYIILNSPEITSVDDALTAMNTKNTTDSTVKTLVDSWYQNNLLNTPYETKIEDTIYCNDRSYPTTTNTFASSGWNANGGNTRTFLYYNGVVSTRKIKCVNTTDQFSVSNSRAHLTYPVGLLSYEELLLVNNETSRKSAYKYWVASTLGFYGSNAIIRSIEKTGYISSDIAIIVNSARPAISLKPLTEYKSGTGAMDDPYIVKMN